MTAIFVPRTHDRTGDLAKVEKAMDIAARCGHEWLKDTVEGLVHRVNLFVPGRVQVESDEIIGVFGYHLRTLAYVWQDDELRLRRPVHIEHAGEVGEIGLELGQRTTPGLVMVWRGEDPQVGQAVVRQVVLEHVLD